MTMYIKNPTKLRIGEAGRSHTPRHQGRYYMFEPGEVKEVDDECGMYLITEYAHFGLIALPDRNKVPDNKKFDSAVKKLTLAGLRRLVEKAHRIVRQYKNEGNEHIENNKQPPKPNEFVRFAFDVIAEYGNLDGIEIVDDARDREIMIEVFGADMVANRDMVMREINQRELKSTLSPEDRPQAEEVSEETKARLRAEFEAEIAAATTAEKQQGIQENIDVDGGSAVIEGGQGGGDTSKPSGTLATFTE